ncbi:hypothetical protein ACWCRD_03080 [Streptomyces sp. NPDC002092]
MAVSCTTNYYGLASTPWDATSANPAAPNGVYARVVPTPPGNGSTQTFFEVLLDGSNKATFAVSGGVFTASVTNAGTATTTTIAASWAAYDPYQYAWWRIQEVSGSFVFSTSPDAYTWTTRATTAYTWVATATKFQFVTGYYATESAGMSAYIDHVNTTSSAPGQPNLNWPMVEDAWAPYWSANGGDSPLDRYVDVTDRTRQTVSVQRGRQYELDQVRSGEASLTLANTDAVLDPTNASSPYYGHILPYQPYRRRAQWPPTRNLLTQVQATGGDLGGYAAGTIPQGSSGIDVFSLADSTGGSIVASATAWQGGTVFQFSVPNATATHTSICYTAQPAVKPGRTYTVQMMVRNVTAATSLQVDAFIVFANLAGTQTTTRSTAATLTGSTTAAWTQVTVTATAPADACRLLTGVETAAAAAAACTVQVDAWQFEAASAASTWTVPGVWFPVYAGFMERWPSSWAMQGTYGVVQPSAVDAFSLLSQKQLSDPLTQEINSNSPRFVYRLDDPSGSTAVSDWTGNYPSAQLGVSKYGAGSLTFGNAITATGASGTYTGATGTVVRIANPNPGTPTVSAATFIRLGLAGILGPISTQWTRVLAFRYTGPTPTSGAYMWTAMDNQRSGGNPSGSRIELNVDSSGHLGFGLAGPSSGLAGMSAGSVNVVDGNWHLAAFGHDPVAGIAFVALDGVASAYSVSSAYAPTNIIGDNLGAYVDPTVGNGTANNFQGDISFACEFPSYLGSTALSNLYTAWKSACSGESSNARYARILRYAGYAGPSTLQTGLTTSMGPAAIDGQDAVSALQGVIDTENGEHFVDRQGFIQFKARSARYNATVPVYVFGENTSAGEWPYEDIATDYDSTHLSNQVTVTQESSGQNFYANDTASATAYFPRTLTRTVNSTSTAECQDAADYLLSRYKQPATRVSSIKLHPSAVPSMWPVCLALELGMRVRVMRRPPGVPATQIECFIENIAWEFGDDGEAWQTLQCSPADTTPYAVFAAWHTTLGASIAAGVTSITVNASADTTNPLATQVGPGQSLVLGQNTANQETVTVSAVGATSPGWTTATITLTAATTKAHTAGDIVCEPLPAGVTDPTTYDAVSKFDSTAFAY